MTNDMIIIIITITIIITFTPRHSATRSTSGMKYVFQQNMEDYTLWLLSVYS